MTLMFTFFPLPVSKNRDSPFNPETRITSKHRKTATDSICEEKLNSWCLFWKRISVFVFLFWVGVGDVFDTWQIMSRLNALLDRRCRFCSWALQRWNCKHQGYSLPRSPNHAKIRQEEWTSRSQSELWGSNKMRTKLKTCFRCSDIGKFLQTFCATGTLCLRFQSTRQITDVTATLPDSC